MAIDKTDFIEQARRLIAIKSVASNTEGLRAALRYMAELLRHHPKITIEYFESGTKPSLLAYAGGNRPSHFRVLLNGHLDVVPAEESQFKLHIEGDRLYGRGTLDMKLAALTMLEAFCELAPTLPYPLGLQLVTDEEIGGHDGTCHQLEQGVTADMMIAGEPSGLAISEASRGLCQVRLTRRGVTAHSAYLWHGENAALLLMKAIGIVLDIYPVPTNEEWRTTVNLSSFMTTHHAINQVPAIATAELDIRFVAEDMNFGSRAAVQTFFHQIDPHLEVEMIQPLGLAHNIPLNHPLVHELSTAIEKVTGKKAAFVRKHGAADTRFYPESLVFGPTGEHLHAPGEYATYNSLKDYRSILAAFLCAVR